MARMLTQGMQLFCLFILLICGAVQAQSNSKVEVRLPQKTLHFETNPRLLDVLRYTEHDHTTYWPAATLYRDSSDLQQRHQQFLADLAELRAYYLAREQQSKANAIHLLLLQVRQWQLAERIELVIDIDRARTKIQYNPMLDDGIYQLQLSSRPRFVFPVGLYRETAPLLHRRAGTVQDYLVSSYRLALADRSRLLVIQPDGSMHTVGVAYWNREAFEPKPGAQLLVPFAERALPRRFRHLNQTLVELAVHRVVIE
ncbi:MAG: capsule biosynthesis GfcC family protein [Alkalimonas sp.]|nr:capsule biosynthesis GfcC family protein [Alkalimonas sp.]